MGGPSQPPVFVLLHMRITPASTEVRVKGGHPGLVAAVAAAAPLRLR